MKHLTSFLESQTEKLYTRYVYTNTGGMDPFYTSHQAPEAIMDRLTQLFPLLHRVPPAPLYPGYRAEVLIRYRTGNQPYAEISVTMDADEWYYVRVPIRGRVVIFQCDQWDGLVQCIQKEVMN